MACVKPLRGYAASNGAWVREAPRADSPTLTVPCGHCVGCRLDNARSWSLRCLHELSFHEEASFITLTYREEDCPHVLSERGGELLLEPTLVKEDLQKFWRALRKRVGKVRYFACGEYGPLNSRPHYHAVVFGHSFPDRMLSPSQGQSKEPLYVSPTLEAAWPHGFSTIGEVTRRSIEYVAQYTVKKLNGKRLGEWKETTARTPEFGVQSRRPGIGEEWIRKWRNDVYPSDSCVVDGVEVRPPRFYDKVIERDHPELVESVREKRRARGKEKERRGDFDAIRLRAKEAILKQQFKSYKRRDRV